MSLDEILTNVRRTGRVANTVRQSASLSAPHYDTHRRGLDFYDPDVHLNPLVTIVGAGGIGSWTALCLSKMGINSIILTDPDVVEPQNVGCQLYSREDIGQPKVDALTATLSGATRFVPQQKKYNSTTPKGIIIAAVDNMEARKEIFVTCKNQGPDVPLFIDCRLGGELLLLYVVPPTNEEACRKYSEQLYTDKEAVDLPCTAQNTAYVGMMAGALISKQVAYFCKRGATIYKEIMFDITNNTLLETR